MVISDALTRWCVFQEEKQLTTADFRRKVTDVLQQAKQNFKKAEHAEEEIGAEDNEKPFPRFDTPNEGESEFD